MYLVIRVDTNQIVRRESLSEARECADEATAKTGKPHLVAKVMGRFEVARVPTRWVGVDDGATD